MPYAHHLFLHFPIALGMVAALFAALAWARPDPRWTTMARSLAYLTLGAAVAAATTGLLSADHLLEDGADASKIELHRNLALAGVGAWAVAVALTWRASRAQAIAESGKSAASDKMAYAATVLAAGVVGLGAHFGGELVHPGMAPWSTEAHSHGMGMSEHDELHASSDGGAMGAMSNMPGMSGMATSENLQPSADAASVASTDASADAAVDAGIRRGAPNVKLRPTGVPPPIPPNTAVAPPPATSPPPTPPPMPSMNMPM